MMSGEEYVSRTKEIVAGVRELSDDQLREKFEELEVGKSRRVSEAPQVVGEQVMYADVLMILGAERGLWDQAGYIQELITERKRDFDYSRKCEKMIQEMWYEKNFPLLVFFIVELTYGIRKIDNQGLLEIVRMVDGPWLFQVPVTNELLEWRLATLRLAVRVVLFDRGYSEDQIQSNYV